MLINLIYTPVMIQILGQSEYGLYTLVGSVVSYLSLFSLGFSGAYLRFYSRYANKNDKVGIARLNGMFLVLFMVMSITAFVCGMVLSCFTGPIFGSNLTLEELEKAEILMRFLVVNIAFTFPSSVMDSIISSQEQFLFQRIVTLVGIICNPFICLPLLFLGYGSVAVVAVTTLITFTKLFVNSWYCLKKLHIQFDFHHFNWGLLKEMAGFSFFLFLNMIIDQINWNLDKILLGRIAGTIAVAVYGVGGQLNSLYISVSTTISSVFAPKVNRIVSMNDDNKELTRLFIKIGRIQYIVMALILTGFIFFGEFFIQMWAGEGYEASYRIALLLIIPVTIPSIQNIGIEIQRAKNMHKARSIVYLCIAMINVLISIPCIFVWKEEGAAFGTAVSLFLGNGIFMNWYYHKKIGIDIISFWKNIIRLSCGLIIPIVIGGIVKNYIYMNNIMEYIISIYFSILFFNLLFIFIILKFNPCLNCSCCECDFSYF